MMKFPTVSGKSNQIPWFQSPPTGPSRKHPVLLWFNSPYALLERNLERKMILFLLGMASIPEMTIFWNQIPSGKLT